MRTIASCLAAAALLTGATALADDSAAADALAAKATDPTASLMSFQFNDWYAPSVRGTPDALNQLVFRAAIPFETAGVKQIFRVTQPVVTSSPGRTGFADVSVFNLAVFDRPWGRWGAGIAGSLPTGAAGLSSDKWSFGPSLGFVNGSNPSWRYGVFVQSYFSIAGRSAAREVGVLNLQPILTHPLGGGRSLSLGNSQLVYDTVQSRWASLQFGVNYGQVVSAFGQKWRPNVEVDYDFRGLDGNARWTFRVGFSLLVPGGS
jgi:hypothetical protein